MLRFCNGWVGGVDGVDGVVCTLIFFQPNCIVEVVLYCVVVGVLTIVYLGGYASNIMK